MVAVALVVLLQEEEWAPTVERRNSGAGSILKLSGIEKTLPDGAIVLVRARLMLDLDRRTPEDVPDAVNELFKANDQEVPFPSGRTRVAGGGWTYELTFPPDTLFPGRYELMLEFDPGVQKPAVAERLPKDVQPFTRRTVVVSIAPGETNEWARDGERVHRAFDQIAHVFERIEEAAQKGGLKRSHIDQTIKAVGEQATLLEPYSQSSWSMRAMKQMFDIAYQIARANEASSDATGTDEDPPAQIGQAAMDAYHNARRMFGAEVYLHARAMLAEMRDRTWRAYGEAVKDGQGRPWSRWKPVYESMHKALTRAHETMMTFDEAEIYLARSAEDAAQSRSVAWALGALDELFEACDKRVASSEADDPEPLMKLLLENLPPAPEQP